MDRPIRVVHYLNQFFGGIGAEEQAYAPVQLKDGAVGPGRALQAAPEVTTVVSTGTGGVDAAFPPVERVIGMRAPEAHWFDEQPPIHGRYGVSHTHDYYGFGRQGYLDY